MSGKEPEQVILGTDATERIVAVATDAEEVTTYRRTPEGVTAERDEPGYVEEIGAALPKGIKLQHDGR